MNFPSSPFNLLFLSFCLLASGSAFSQNIGVNGTGNNPDPSAMLHVEAADKGLIVPRVQLDDTADAAPINVAPAEGLVVYNETGTAPTGFYYWDDGKGQWFQVGTGATDEDWTRDPAEGQMYPTNLGDSIGIGVQEPNAELDIRGRDVDLGSNRAAVKITDQSDGDTLYMDGDEISGGLGGGSGQEEALYLQLGTSEDLVMADGPALVGIGGAANYPNYKFDMTGGDARFMGSSDNHLLFTDHSSDRVGIGTNAPDTKLHVYHDEPNAGVARFNNPNSEGFAGIYFDQGTTTERGWIGFVNPSSGFGGPDLMQVASGYTDMVFSTNGSGFYNEKMRIEVSGEVGIGYSAPAYMLAVNGDTYFNGDAWAVDHRYISDKKFKKDVRPLEGALDQVLALEGVRYDWKKERFADLAFEKREQIGMIAQEVEKVVPELVSKAKGPKGKEDFKGVSYAKVVPLLIEAIKEQQKQIDSLRKEASGSGSEAPGRKSLKRIEERNEALEAENEELRQKQKSLEKRLQKLEKKVDQDR